MTSSRASGNDGEFGKTKMKALTNAIKKKYYKKKIQACFQVFEPCFPGV